MATGDVLSFLNTDDSYSTGAFQTSIDILETDPDASLVWGSADIVEMTSNGKKENRILYPPRVEKEIIPFLLYVLPIFNACFFRKQVFEHWGLLMSQLKIAGDREFMLRVALGGGKFHPSEEILYHYYSHDTSRTFANNPDIFKQWNDEHCQIAEHYLKMEETRGIARSTYQEIHTISNLSLIKIHGKKGEVTKAIRLALHGWQINPRWPWLFLKRSLLIFIKNSKEKTPMDPMTTDLLKGDNHLTCPLCQIPLRETQVLNFYPAVVCGLLIRSTKQEMDGLYQAGWQNPLENANLTGGTTPGLARNYTRELLRTLKLENLNGKKILDFGGGRGELTLALEEIGAQVVAVDPYSYVQLQKLGLTAIESLDQLGAGQSFDGAVAIDVIEHLTTPWEELGKIRALLVAGGWLYLSTPNGRGLNALVNHRKWREASNPSHLLLFTPNSVEKTLLKAGFAKYLRLRWRINYSGKMLVQVKDWFLRAIWRDGVLRYLAYK